ncbi:unnamed protein product [Cylicocyclus nassatus]|uniref:SET domain-containing protein n=1 Tax=Cylicocyclus nassatus TaxID=53992 RepID=A0AA36MCL7_CYLNA|nr:unnamed protein product [Cylicocyclus nassatus]
MLCFNPAIITVFVLLSESTHAVFYATKMDAVSTTGLPHLPELNQRIFHENGFHGEVIGFAAKREEECGIVLLDYGSYTNGDMFNHILEKLEDTLKDNNTLDQALRAKVFAAQKEQALKENMEEMSKLFERYRSNTPHYNTAQVTFFGGLGLIAFGIGIGIGKLVYNGVTSLMRSFVKGEQLQHLDMELIAIYKKLDNLAKILEVQINKNRFDDLNEQTLDGSRGLLSNHKRAGSVVEARVTTDNLTIELQITLPVSNMSFEPIVGPDDNHNDGAAWYSYGCHLNSLLLATFSLDPIIFETSKMAERVRAQKYKEVLEIGNAARESFERLKEERIVRFLPPKIFEEMFYPKFSNEGTHFCVVCGKQGEFRLREHLLKAHKDELKKGTMDFKEFYERVERNKYALRAEMDVGMQRLEESVQKMGRRLELRDAMQREEEPGTSYAHIEEDALERDSSAIDMMEAKSTSKSQAIQSYEASKAAKQGGPVEKVFKTAPNVELMFCYEMDDQAPGYYKEDYIVPKKQKNKWQGKVDVELKYYRKLDGRMHPLLREFEEYISEALPDALARKGNPLKNGTWGYVSCINRFMLAAMRARKRKFIDLRLEPVAGRERRDVLKHGKKLFLDYMAKLNVEEKQTLSFQGIVPSEKKKGEPYCVARAVVEHKGVEEAVEKIMKIFEQKGTLQPAQYNYVMGALWCYIIHCNTSRNECIYKMMYGSICRSEEEDVTSVNEWERTGLQEFVMDFGDEVEERLWTRHAIADLQYENDYQQKIDEMAKVPGVDKECAHTTEMDDFDEDDVVEEEGDEEEATRILLEEKGDEEEATRNLDVAGNKGDGQTEPILRADTRQRSSRPLTETESSPRKRPRVSLPVEDVPGEMQASSSSSLKQFDRPPTDNDEGLVTAKISEASAEPIMSDVTRATASETVHAIHDVADTTRYTISDLERRFEPLDPSLHLEALNETPYTGGLTKIATVPQQNQFLRRSHAQPVQDFPWLEVREMPTINRRGVYAKVDIAKEMAVADVRGYQGKVEDIRNSLKQLNEEERHKVIKYWHGFRRRGCDFILLAHCDSYKATVTLGRLINQSIEHANLVLRCIRFGERRVRWLHCLVAKRDIKAGEQLLWNYGRTERNPNIPNFPDNYPCICQVCDPAAAEASSSFLQSARRSIHVQRVWNFERSLSEEDLSLHERPEFDIGELLFLVTQKARAVGLLLEKTPAADPRVAFAISRRTVFTKSDVFPDPAMFLVKVASPLAQLLQIATEAAFEHMESVVLILYRKRNDPKPLVILLGSRHLEDDGHRYGCCVAVVGEEIYAVECQAEARADEMPLHLELLEAGPLTRHFPSLTIEPRSEDAIMGAVIATMSAIDGDESQEVYYRLQEPSKEFSLNSTTGEVVLTLEQKIGASNAENAEMDDIEVWMALNVIVTDVNDNGPLFEESRYFMLLEKNAIPGEEILTVRASDPDQPMPGSDVQEVFYRIKDMLFDYRGMNRAVESMFSTDKTTGVIRLEQEVRFQREKKLREDDASIVNALNRPPIRPMKISPLIPTRALYEPHLPAIESNYAVQEMKMVVAGDDDRRRNPW